MIDEKTAQKIVDAGITQVKIRSILNLSGEEGCLREKCYGANLANGQPVGIGEAVGVISAQSIGEPGTQLTMRTFHTGGVASASDITQGLPRVEELFEARKPKNAAIISHVSGVANFRLDHKGANTVNVTSEDGEVFTKIVPFDYKIIVQEGQYVEKGQLITEGSVEPGEVLAVSGELAVQDYLIKEVQRVYRTQGVDINDKAHRGYRSSDDAQGPHR